MNLTCPNCQKGDVWDRAILDDDNFSIVKCDCCGWEGNKNDLVWTFRVSCLCLEESV